MTLSTSNQNKIKEFKRMLGNEITIIEGADIKEVNGTMDEVIIHKAIDAGEDMLVEDTILIIDGKEVVDIRWNQADKLKNAKKAQWVVSLGYNSGSFIYVYRGIINGIIVEPLGEGFGFDPYFLPDGSDITLAQLEAEGNKDKFSARSMALFYLKHKNYSFIRDIKNTPAWTGTYQND